MQCSKASAVEYKMETTAAETLHWNWTTGDHYADLPLGLTLMLLSHLLGI